MKDVKKTESINAKRKLFMQLAGLNTSSMMNAYVAMNQSEMLNPPAKQHGTKTKTK